MFTIDLKQIVEKENLVLIDNSCITANQIILKMYDYSFYRQLNLNDLIITEKRMESVCNSIDGKVKAIPETLTEMKYLQQILNDKAKNFNNRENISSRRFVSNSYQESKGMERKDVFNNICYLINETIRKAKRNLYRPNNPGDYDILTNAVKIITEKANLKRFKTKWPREPREFRREYVDHNTDEKIISALFNASLEGNSAAAVSRDTDLISILAVSHKLLASKDILPYNKLLIEKLNQNPVRLYLPSNKEDFDCYALSFVSNERKAQQRFVIYRISEEENKKIREQFQGMLSKLGTE